MRTSLFLMAAFVVAGSVQAGAGPISITGSSSDPRYVASTDVNKNLGSESAICTAFGLGTGCLGGSSLLYKKDVDGGAESGLAGLKASYNTTFSLAADNKPDGATISYVGSVGSLLASCPSCYLLVKDGNHNPAQYLFSLNALTLPSASPAWDGKGTITLTGFWPAGGAISNVAIWGTSTKTDQPLAVPDGGATLSLMGVALVGLGVLRRKFSL